MPINPDATLKITAFAWVPPFARGQVPVLDDDGIEIFENGAILLHIAQKDARLLPTEPQASARAISWFFAALNSIEPLMFELTNVNVFALDGNWRRSRHTRRKSSDNNLKEKHYGLYRRIRDRSTHCKQTKIY